MKRPITAKWEPLMIFKWDPRAKQGRVSKKEYESEARAEISHFLRKLVRSPIWI